MNCLKSKFPSSILYVTINTGSDISSWQISKSTRCAPWISLLDTINTKTEWYLFLLNSNSKHQTECIYDDFKYYTVVYYFLITRLNKAWQQSLLSRMYSHRIQWNFIYIFTSIIEFHKTVNLRQYFSWVLKRKTGFHLYIIMTEQSLYVC